MGTSGIITCGGGYSYFTNAWVLARLLRHHGSGLPLQNWIHESEWSPRMEWLAERAGMELKVLAQDDLGLSNAGQHPGRWQWVMKLEAILRSAYGQVLFLDADSFPVRAPDELFDSPGYRSTGAVFWPDIGQTERERPIWEVMGVPWRAEAEFEAGQVLVDKQRCREPLELALWMNRRADFFYHHIWGDKDTFRFAWHKFGRSYTLMPYPLQMLALPGRTHGDIGVMCQHDFEGERLFQHRNMAKWDLLGHNPRVSGYLFEGESREYLAELRGLWNGRIGWDPPRKKDAPPREWEERRRLEKELCQGTWLVDDRRPRPQGCCGPPVPWTQERTSKPWVKERTIAEERMHSAANVADTSVQSVSTLEGLPANPTTEKNGEVKKIPAVLPPPWMVGLRYTELAFGKDSVLTKGAGPQSYWWDLAHTGKRWQLTLSNDKGVVAKLHRREDDTWWGIWVGANGAKLVLRRVEVDNNMVSAGTERTSSGAHASGRALHLANHAFGIGDAVTGLYAAVGAAEQGRRVVYHTRFPSLLARASHPNLEITDEAPPKGTRDMDTDYFEQLRYAHDKVKWYARQAAGKLPVWNGARPLIDSNVRIPRVDFARYVVMSPFAASESRDWPEMHWRRLANLLRGIGRDIVVIGIEKEEERIARTFETSYAYWAIRRDDGWSEWVTDLMLGAEAVIGLDSGMVHVAGLLGVPAVCIHAHLPPDFLFSCAPTVRSVAPQTDCTFCRGQEDRGYSEGCNAACSALATVGPERVMAELAAIEAAKKSVFSSEKR